MSDNYYRFFVGDYLRDTGDLSLIEHGAYRILLDHYYMQEWLPVDRQKLYRICRAFTDDERRAIDVVVERYFTENGNGRLKNRKAEEEIENRRQYISEQTRKSLLGVKARGLTQKQSADNPQVDPRADPKVNPPSPSPSPIYKKNIKDIPSKFVGEFKNVNLSEEEYKNLITKFGDKDTEDRINRLSEYIASKGKRYKSHYATILAWARKDGWKDGNQASGEDDDNLFLRGIREERERKARKRMGGSPPPVPGSAGDPSGPKSP